MFWLALLLPLLPTLAIAAVSALAAAIGCMADPMAACRLGPLSLGHAVAAAVRLAYGTGLAMTYGVPVVLALCYLALQLGVRRLRYRLLLAFLVFVLLSYLPTIGPGIAMEGLVHPGCAPNEGGVGDCTLFAVPLGQAANELVVLGWFSIVTAPLAILAFLIYVLLALVLRARERSPADTATTPL